MRNERGLHVGAVAEVEHIAREHHNRRAAALVDRTRDRPADLTRDVGRRIGEPEVTEDQRPRPAPELDHQLVGNAAPTVGQLDDLAVGQVPAGVLADGLIPVRLICDLGHRCDGNPCPVVLLLGPKRHCRRKFARSGASRGFHGDSAGRIRPYASRLMTSILLVEDDLAIAQPLLRALEREGFEVAHVTSGDAAVAAPSAGVDLVLLDLTLPGLDGLAVCRTLRTRDERLPIIMLTARSEETDIVVGLDAGADDYITKPFRLAELLARVRVRLRLATPRQPPLVQGVLVDPEAHRAWQDSVELDLTPKEFDVLTLLVVDAGRVVARQRLMQEVWDEHYYGSTRTLDMHISSLRKKLGDDPTSPRLITTVRGVGFRFETG